MADFSGLWREGLVGKVRDEFRNFPVPKILSFVTSFQYIADAGCSVSRFGDGEMRVATGGIGPAFQENSPSLQQALCRVLKEPKARCANAITAAHFYQSPFTIPGIDHYCQTVWASYVREHRAMFDLLKQPQPYLDAVLSIPRHHYNLGDDYFRRYFEMVGAFFAKKNIVLVSGDPESAAFYRQYAHDIRELSCPRTNAWAERERIVTQLRQVNRNGEYTVVLQCGPLASYLAWELCDDMQCLDLGHLGKEWAWYRQGKAAVTGGFFGT